MARKKRVGINSQGGKSKTFKFSQDQVDAAGWEGSAIPTYEELKKMYAPAVTMGAPEDAVLALDAQIEDSGAYTLIQHTLEMGYDLSPQFMGYAALSSISQNGLVRTCIETVSDEMTKEWVEVKRKGKGKSKSDDKTSDEPIQRIVNEMERFNLKDIFNKAANLDGYQGGCLIFIDTGVSGAELETPLNLSKHSSELKDNGLKGFTLIEPINVFPGEYNSTNPLSKDYYKPKSWWISGQKVHASRLIRIVTNEVPLMLKASYNFLGIPQAQILWDYILHFQECRTASSRLLTKFSLTAFKTQMTDILYNSAGTKNLDMRVQMMVKNQSNDGIVAIDKETEDLVKIETPLGGVVDIVTNGLELIVAINRTPAVKLLGLSPAGFNATGEGDLTNFRDNIATKQQKISPGIKVAFDAIQISVNGEIDPTIICNFVGLDDEDEMNKAVINREKSTTHTAYLDRDVVTVEEVRQALSDDPESGFSGIDASAVPPESDMRFESEEESMAGA